MGKSIIKSVSITDEQADFLDENKEISLSSIIQNRLIEIMEYQKKCTGCLKLTNFERFNKKLTQFISERGLMDDFIKWTT